MSKDLDKYIDAKDCAVRFIKAVNALEKRYADDEYVRRYFKVGTGVAERASVKRASMDLTKLLAKVRKTE